MTHQTDETQTYEVQVLRPRGTWAPVAKLNLTDAKIERVLCSMEMGLMQDGVRIIGEAVIDFRGVVATRLVPVSEDA